MTDTASFLLKMLLLTAVAAALILVLQQFSFFKPLLAPSWFSLAYFSVSTALLYFLAHQGTQSRQHAKFMAFIFGAMGIKVMFSVIIIVGYYFIFKPGSRLFILPFLFFYVVYTIFETIYLAKAAKKIKLE